jgi:hypothetical protein
MSAQRFTPRDDKFHFAEMGDDWWATETSWFSFHHPERKLGGWFYSMFRPNIGTVAGGAWVWDDSAYLPWEILYSANYSAQQLSREQDLDDCQLGNGVSIKVLQPCQRYALGYDDGDRFKANLIFDGVMPPEPLTAVGSTFGSAHHFDQFGRVTGEIVLHGERITLDCIGMRDRTWGRRPEDRPRQAAYVTGAADGNHGFLAVTNVKPEGDLISYGFLRRDGETVSLAGGERILERDPREHWVTRITIKAQSGGRAGQSRDSESSYLHRCEQPHTLGSRWSGRLRRRSGHVAGASLGASEARAQRIKTTVDKSGNA